MPLPEISKRIVRRLLMIGQNRLDLLALEARMERWRLLQALFMALGAGVFGLLAGMTLTAALIVWLWAHSPVVVLLALAVFYGAIGIGLCRMLSLHFAEWRMFSASLDQLGRDRAGLEKILV